MDVLTIATSAWSWIIVGLIFAGLEIMVPGVFLLWVGLGALVVGLALTLFPDMTLAWQAVVFAVSMLASVGLGFVVQRRKQQGTTELNREMDQLVGRQCEVSQAFKAAKGRVRLGDTTYAAVGPDELAVGQIVRITQTRGSTLVVEPV